MKTIQLRTFDEKTTIESTSVEAAVSELSALVGRDDLIEGKDYNVFVRDPWKHSHLLFAPGKSESECNSAMSYAQEKDPWVKSSESAFGICNRN